jgi:type II secretory pathway pseudopilin PulG
MMTKRTASGDGRQVTTVGGELYRATRHSSRVARSAFSMVELMVTMTLLSLIVLALMAVFSSTQRAFRASVTQTDVLEGSRATMDLMTADFRTMAPSYGMSNAPYVLGVSANYGGVNFFAGTNYYNYTPLVQSLPGTSTKRCDSLEYFFILGKQNTKWTGVGYIVNAGSSSPLYPLYRFYKDANISANPVVLYTNFLSTVYYAQYFNQWTNSSLSHVMDGVAHLTVHAYDAAGYQMTNTYQFRSSQEVTNRNIWFAPQPLPYGEVGFIFYTNAVPASVELQLGVLEDRTMQRAQSLGISGTPPPSNPAQWSYLQNQAGHVHLFRQRVTIPNVDPSAYQ